MKAKLPKGSRRERSAVIMRQSPKMTMIKRLRRKDPKSAIPQCSLSRKRERRMQRFPSLGDIRLMECRFRQIHCPSLTG
jgi:hypothetical protein